MKNLKIQWLLGGIATAILFSAYKPKNPDYFKLPKPLKDQFAFITGGKYYVEGDTLEGEAFYMSTSEVSNAHYRNFLQYMQEKDGGEIQASWKVDSTVWKEFAHKGSNPMANFYHQHPAYNDYPVVGITLEGAKAYCAYLNEILNKDTDNKYTYEASLPTRTQWLRASYTAHQPSYPYAWKGYYLRNDKGDFMCNFYHVSAEKIHRDKEGQLVLENVKNAPADLSQMELTAPVFSYWPSLVGLYNMNGNVAELTADGLVCGGSWNDPGYDVRNDSYFTYEKPTNTIGFRPILKVTLK